MYSQGELSEIGKQAGKRAQLSDLLQFVEPEFKREDERLNADIDAAKLVIRQALQGLSAAWRQQARLHKLNTGKSSLLEQRITALQKTLPQLSPKINSSSNVTKAWLNSTPSDSKQRGKLSP